MKKFEMTVKAPDNNSEVYFECENTGFTAGEIVGLLEIKKQDIIAQLNRPGIFKHKRILNKDDDQISIEEVEGNDTN